MKIQGWTGTWETVKDPMGEDNKCKDFDDDCKLVRCKTSCWLYDPTQGWCPYLKGVS